MTNSIPDPPHPALPPQAVPDDKFRRIFTSEPIAFRVGKDEKSIHANAAAIAELSEPLSKLVNAGVTQANKSVPLPDVLEDDFVRVCQFAYTGDYTIVPSAIAIDDPSIGSPSCAATEDTVPDAVSETVVPEVPSQSPVSKLPKKKRNKRKTSVAEVTQEKETEMVNGDSIHESMQESTQEKVEALPVSIPEPPQQNLFLLEHARLYVFGEQWAVEPLKLLSITKLAEHVQTAEVDSYFVEKFVELTRYSYSNTTDSGKDALRNFVIRVLNTHLEAIGKSGSFPLLLEDGGPFVRELWGVLQQKLFQVAAAA